MTAESVADEILGEVFHDESGRLTAFLIRFTGDFALAEDIVQDVLVTALQHWRSNGVPANARAWLFSTAKFRAIDRLRRETNLTAKVRQLEESGQETEDDRLRLIFTCCHPALSRESQIALTLRTVCGLSTEQIASAFLQSESAIVQRLTRARRKIRDAGIPYRVPPAEELDERLHGVLAVIYLLFNEGYLSGSEADTHRADLASEAEWLARTLSVLMPLEAEILGLLSLIQLHQARADARFDGSDHLVLLRNQDRTLWDRQAVADATDLLMKAGSLGRTGPYQLQAAIVACHAEAHSWEETDWLQIWLLYESLLQFDSSPVIRLNRAIALKFVAGAASALDEIESLSPELERYHLYHSTRAELLRDLERREEAREADVRALQLTENRAERALIEQRLT